MLAIKPKKTNSHRLSNCFSIEAIEQKNVGSNYRRLLLYFPRGKHFTNSVCLETFNCENRNQLELRRLTFKKE